MNPYDCFRAIIYKKLSFVGAALGQDIFDENFKINILTVAELTYMFLAAPCLAIWTALYGNRNLAMKAMSFIPITFQVNPIVTITLEYNFTDLFRFMQGLIYAVFPLFARENIIANFNYLKTVYEKKYKIVENWPIFLNFIKLLKTCLKIMLMNYLICSISFMLSPLILYSIGDSIIEPIFPYYLPGLTSGSQFGFALNYLVQIMSLAYSCGMFVFYNVLFIVQVMHVILLTNIQKTKIRRVSQMAVERRPSYMKTSMFIRQIIVAHTEGLA